MKEWTTEEKHLKRFVYLVWKPSKSDIPKFLKRMSFHRLSSFRCWESIPMSNSVVIYNHGITNDKNSRTFLQLHSHRGDGRYVIKQDKITQEHWKLAYKTVKGPPSTNLESWERTIQDLNEHFGNLGKLKKKKKNCKEREKSAQGKLSLIYSSWSYQYAPNIY